MDLAGLGRLRPAQAGAHHRRRRKTAFGASATTSAADLDPRPAGFCDTPGCCGYPGEAPETLREVSRTPEGQPLGPAKRHPALKTAA
jgi:hypothetical protein